MRIRKRVVILTSVLLVMGAGALAWQHIVAQSRGNGIVLGVTDIADRLKNPHQSAAQIEALRSLNLRSSAPVPHELPAKLRALQVRLPGGYEVRSSEDDPERVRRLAASTMRDGFRRLTIVTEEHPSLDDISAIQMRRHSPRLYREERITVAGTPALVFTSRTTDHYERVVFVKHGTFVTSFAVSTDMAAAAELAEQDMGAVLGSVEWLL